MMVFMTDKPASMHMVNILLGNQKQTKIADDYEFNEMELSALSEIGNIIAGAYLSSLSTLN